VDEDRHSAAQTPPGTGRGALEPDALGSEQSEGDGGPPEVHLRRAERDRRSAAPPLPLADEDARGPSRRGAPRLDLRPQESALAVVASGASTPALTCTDDFECEDLEPPPSPPPEEEDIDPAALMWTTDPADFLALAVPATGRDVPSSVLDLASSSRVASTDADSLAAYELMLPPSPVHDFGAKRSSVQDRLAALELAGPRRCGNIREYCADLECRIASAAEQMEDTVAYQLEVLSKIESTVDDIIHGVSPLFAAPL